VRHLFDGIVVRVRALLPSPLNARSDEERTRAMLALEDWFGGEFSLGILCGTVLQIAAHEPQADGLSVNEATWAARCDLGKSPCFARTCGQCNRGRCSIS
jgi:hypothetical protein